MLDIKFVRENLDAVQAMLSNRQNKLSLDGFKELEEKRRAILSEVEVLKNKRNTVSKQVGQMYLFYIALQMYKELTNKRYKEAER